MTGYPVSWRTAPGGDLAFGYEVPAATSPLPPPEVPRPGEPTTVGGSRQGPRWPK